LKLTGVTVFSGAAALGHTFNQGVPCVARGAFAKPTRRAGAAVGAGENGFIFGHDAKPTTSLGACAGFDRQAPFSALGQRACGLTRLERALKSFNILNK
jgi:hypothetical protein